MRNILFLALFVLLLGSACVNCPAYKGSCDIGKPQLFSEFPIGVYSPKLDDASMQDIKNSGFNTFLVYNSDDASYDKMLELADKHGLKVFLRLSPKLIVEEGGLEEMRRIVRKYRHHSAISSWYLYDEPSGDITPAVIEPFYRMLRQESPNIPVSIVMCWDFTWDQYSSVLDVQMADIYPVRNAPYPNAYMQQFTNFMRDTVKLGKPTIAVAQTVSYYSFPKLNAPGTKRSDFRYPNPIELRYMIFGAMNYGMDGVFGYSYWHANFTGNDRGWWNRVCSPAFNELKDFVKLVDQPSKPQFFKRALDGNQSAAYWTAGDEGFLVLANEWPQQRVRPGCWTEGFFTQDYDLIPWGNSRKVNGEIVDNRIKVDGSAEPWEVFIWKVVPKAKEQ